MELGRNERIWASKVGLVGLFEVEWVVPRHELLMDFLKTWKYNKHLNQITKRVTNKGLVIDTHMILQIFKISPSDMIEGKQHNTIDAQEMSKYIATPDVYVENEQWIVSKMKHPYNIRHGAIL
jgi:hypothetical protein